MKAGRVEEGIEPARLGKVANPAFFYGYVVTAAGFAIWFIGWGTYTPSFGVFFKPLLAEFGWTRAETALGYSVSTFVQAALAIVMGWLTDKVGPRVVVTAFGSCLGICYLFASQVSALWQFQISYVVVGAIGLSALNVPVMATIARWFVKRRGLMIGIVQTGVGTGGFIFPPLVGWLILAYGWRSAYVVLGIIALSGIITAGLFFRRAPSDIGQPPDGASPLTGPAVTEQNPSVQTAGLSLREALRTSQFWMIAGIHCCFGLCRSTFLVHLAAHVQDLGFSLADGANVLAIVSGSSVIGRIGMGRLADVIGNRPAFIISFAATAVILMWGLVAEQLWGLYLFAFVFGFGWGAQAVLRFAVTSEAFGLVSLGLVMGVLGLAEAGAGTFGSYFAGYIFDVAGDYDPAFWMGIAVSIGGVILTWLLKPAMRKGHDSGETNM